MVHRPHFQLTLPLLIVLGFWFFVLSWAAVTLYTNRFKQAKLVYPMQESLGSYVQIQPHVPLSQTFRLIAPQLESIEIMSMATESADLSGHLRMSFRVHDEIQTATIPLSQMKSSPLIAFKLQPLHYKSEAMGKLTLLLEASPGSRLHLKSIDNMTLNKTGFWAYLEQNDELLTTQLMFRPNYASLDSITTFTHFNWLNEVRDILNQLFDGKPTWVTYVIILSAGLSVLVTSRFIYEISLLFTKDLSVKSQARLVLYLVIGLLLVTLLV